MKRRETVIITILSILSIVSFLGIAYPFRVSKLRNELETIKQENIELRQELELLEKENYKLNFEKSLERTCGLEVVECENDWKFEALVSATFRLETGNGKSTLWLDYNNAGGIKCGSEYCRYESEEQGYNALETLLKRYVEKYEYNLRDIRKEYCGIHCSEKDLIEFEKIFDEEVKRLCPN